MAIFLLNSLTGINTRHGMTLNPLGFQWELKPLALIAGKVQKALNQ
jgi:hypothetical protein